MTPTLPIIEGEITIDPKDPEVLKILGTLCIQAGPIAHIFQRSGYPIPTHAEEEQGHIILWMLAQYKAHGAEWRTKANEVLREMVKAQADKGLHEFKKEA